MIRCQICGHLNSDKDKFCGECGNKLSEPANYCPNCNVTYDNLNKFCTGCGTKLVVKSDYLKSISQNKNRRPNPQDNFIENLIANSKIKQKINKKDVVIIVGEKTSDYAYLSDYELIHMLETAKDNRWHATKSGDMNAHEQLNRQISSLEAELHRRNINIY